MRAPFGTVLGAVGALALRASFVDSLPAVLDLPFRQGQPAVRIEQWGADAL